MQAIIVHNGFKCMLVDNGSIVNILFESAFDQMQVDRFWLPMVEPFYSFTGDSLIPKGHITLIIEIVCDH